MIMVVGGGLTILKLWELVANMPNLTARFSKKPLESEEEIF